MDGTLIEIFVLLVDGADLFLGDLGRTNLGLDGSRQKNGLAVSLAQILEGHPGTLDSGLPRGVIHEIVLLSQAIDGIVHRFFIDHDPFVLGSLEHEHLVDHGLEQPLGVVAELLALGNRTDLPQLLLETDLEVVHGHDPVIHPNQDCLQDLTFLARDDLGFLARDNLIFLARDNLGLLARDGHRGHSGQDGANKNQSNSHGSPLYTDPHSETTTDRESPSLRPRSRVV